MNWKNIAMVVAACVLGFVAGRAGVDAAPLSAGARGSRVARFDGGAIGDQDFVARVGTQPPSVRALLAKEAQRKAFLENMVRFELLAQEAVRKGYDRDPQFLQETKQRLGQLLIEKDVEAPVKAKAPTEDDLKKFYEQNKAALSRPERVRVAAVSFAAAESD